MAIVRVKEAGVFNRSDVNLLFYFRPNLLHMEKLVFTSFSAFAEE